MSKPYIIYTLIHDNEYHKFILEQILKIEKGSKLSGMGRLTVDQAIQVISNKYKEEEFVDIENIKDDDPIDVEVIMREEMDSDPDEFYYEEPYYIETSDNSNIEDNIEPPIIDAKKLDIIVIISDSIVKDFMPEIGALENHITEVIIIHKDNNQQLQNIDHYLKNLKISYINDQELIPYLNALLNDEFPYRGVEINGINIQEEVKEELLGNKNNYDEDL